MYGIEPPHAQQSPDGSLTLSRLIVWVKQIATHGRMARAGGSYSDWEDKQFIQKERKKALGAVNRS